MKQTSTQKFWEDEAGTQIPYNRTTAVERLMEIQSDKLLSKAAKIHEKLAAFKTEVAEICQQVYDAFIEERQMKVDGKKGNFTWYNFDRSIKIEVSVNEKIEFDDLVIKAAKEKFDQFLEDNITSKNEFAKEMIIDAFETQRTGKLDTKRVMQLTRYEKKINDALFSEAVALINESIRRPQSKTYFRIWAKDEAGEFQNVDLNFSSI
jgi:predicted regulator of Ras-like GTPase activity (Roadblock/LC7/MglB family)